MDMSITYSTGWLNRRHYYYSLNNNGINYIKGKLGITEQKVQPRTRAPRNEAFEQTEGDDKRREGRGGFRGKPRDGARDGPRRPREDKPRDDKPKEDTPKETPAVETK